MKLSTLLRGGSRSVRVLLGEEKVEARSLKVDEINPEALQLLRRIEAEKVVVTKKAIEALQLLKPQDFFDWLLVLYPKLTTFQRCRDKLGGLLQRKVKEATNLKVLLPLSESLPLPLCRVVAERAMQLRDAEVAAAFLFIGNPPPPSSPTTLLLHLYKKGPAWGMLEIEELIGKRALRRVPEKEISKLLEDEEERRFGEQIIAKLEERANDSKRQKKQV